jgi:acyl carrier protein
VLSSRSGPSTPEVEAFLTGLRGRGVDVLVALADIAAPDDVDSLFEQISDTGHPLKGVFHLAMVIDDTPVSTLTRERMRCVMDPKAMGAWLLHEKTRTMKIDAFVMFSSVSSIFGNPAQGNYAAANAFLDALARHRQAAGLPALAINWGALGGEGYVGRNERVAEYLARQGTIALSPQEVILLMESFLSAGTCQVLALRADWGKWRTASRGGQENPLLERIFADGVEGMEPSGTKGDWHQKIASAPPEKRMDVIILAVLDVVGSVLRVKPESLRADQPLTDLGLDSLLAVEIETSLDGALGVALPPASMMRARTIQQIAVLIEEHLAGSHAGDPSAADAPPAETSPAETVDLAAFSDDEIDRLLGGEISADRPEECAPAK